MGKRATFSDDAIICALLANGTTADAAAALGCNPRTIRIRLQKPTFRARYERERSEILRACSARLHSRLVDAVDTLAEIMQDRNTAAQTRANAAQTILQTALRYTELVDIVSRIDALETRLNAGGDGNESYS